MKGRSMRIVESDVHFPYVTAIHVDNVRGKHQNTILCQFRRLSNIENILSDICGYVLIF